MYLADCHTHSKISPDSSAPLALQAEAALTAGLSGLWVTDHCDLLDHAGHAISGFDWPGALAQVKEVRDSLKGGLELHLGLELGSAPFCPDTARSIIAGGGQELDFVLGSLHNWIGAHENGEFYFTDYTDDPALCRETMDNVLNSTWTLVTECPDCYDSLAHIIYPIRYMHRDGQMISILDYEDRVREILKEVARTDHALELNTNRGRDLAPWQPILRWFKECGGKYVTVGSDAHEPSDVGKGIREAREMVLEAGFRGLTVFRGRKPYIEE